MPEIAWYVLANPMNRTRWMDGRIKRKEGRIVVVMCFSG